MTVTRFTFLTECFVNCCYQVTNIFQLWARLLSRNLGLSESACSHCAYSNPVPLLLATSWEIHEMNWQRLDPLAQGFLRCSVGLRSSTKISLKSCSQSSIHAIDRFVFLRVLNFYFRFRFLLVHAAGFPVAPHSYLHFFRVLDFCCIC